MLNKRNELSANNDFSSFKEANKFKEAETIVIAAPYYDLSFPSALKVYIENIMISNLTFTYSIDGNPINLSNVKRLFYVSTSGGPLIDNNNEGFNYIKLVLSYFFNVEEFHLIHAECLDIIGNDPNKILEDKIKEINNLKL